MRIDTKVNIANLVIAIIAIIISIFAFSASEKSMKETMKVFVSQRDYLEKLNLIQKVMMQQIEQQLAISEKDLNNAKEINDTTRRQLESLKMQLKQAESISLNTSNILNLSKTQLEVAAKQYKLFDDDFNKKKSEAIKQINSEMAINVEQAKALKIAVKNNHVVAGGMLQNAFDASKNSGLLVYIDDFNLLNKIFAHYYFTDQINKKIDLFNNFYYGAGNALSNSKKKIDEIYNQIDMFCDSVIKL